MAVTAITSAAVNAGHAPAGASQPRQAAPAGAFAESLGRLIDSVEATTGEANSAVGNMLNKTGEVHDAMIALHHAETALQLTVQIRNKLVQAYQEIMRMPI